LDNAAQTPLLLQAERGRSAATPLQRIILRTVALRLIRHAVLANMSLGIVSNAIAPDINTAFVAKMRRIVEHAVAILFRILTKPIGNLCAICQNHDYQD
jgi:hypothetical protein